MNKMYAYLLTGVLLGGLSTTVLAQGSGGPLPGPGDTVPNGPTGVPLDGGASLLLAGSVAYGLKRLRRRKS